MFFQQKYTKLKVERVSSQNFLYKEFIIFRFYCKVKRLFVQRSLNNSMTNLFPFFS